MRNRQVGAVCSCREAIDVDRHLRRSDLCFVEYAPDVLVDDARLVPFGTIHRQPDDVFTDCGLKGQRIPRADRDSDVICGYGHWTALAPWGSPALTTS